MELTDRELAVRWWNRISTNKKRSELDKAGLKLDNLDKLSENEIYWVWLKNQII